jgi:hypothetical protein
MACFGFQDRCLKPLGHPSNPAKSITYAERQENKCERYRRVGPNLDPNYFKAFLDSMPMISAARASAFLVRLA